VLGSWWFADGGRGRGSTVPHEQTPFWRSEIGVVGQCADYLIRKNCASITAMLENVVSLEAQTQFELAVSSRKLVSSHGCVLRTKGAMVRVVMIQKQLKIGLAKVRLIFSSGLRDTAVAISQSCDGDVVAGRASEFQMRGWEMSRPATSASFFHNRSTVNSSHKPL
jgi:hypothetical protein